MAVTQHKSKAHHDVGCAVITLSDTRNRETDTSGGRIRALLTEAGHRVVAYQILKDDPEQLTAALRALLTRPEVDAVISDLLEGGPAALAASKQLLRRVPKLGFDEGLDWTEQLSASLFAGSEAAEGMSAFLQKRRPAWAQNEWNTRPEDHRLRPRPRSREGNHG